MAARKKGGRAAAASVETVEQVESGGMGVEGAIITTTFIFLIAAVFLVWNASQTYPS